jgi:hypothetical protein
MKKLKHSKFRNTGILFELLVQRFAVDCISGKDSEVPPILKKYFNSNTELHKEYVLYKTLAETKYTNETKCNLLIEAVLKSRKKLNLSKLISEKKSLVGTIRDVYGLEDFFQNSISNYKQLASIYKIFEYKEQDNPIDHTRARITLIESIISSKPDDSLEKVNAITESSEDLDVMMVSMSLMVDKFNSKYSGMSSSQRDVLKEYIEAETNSQKMKYFLQNHADSLKVRLQRESNRISDPIIKIKVIEVVKLLEDYSSIKRVEDNHVSAILRFYSLVEDLTEFNKKSGK